MTNEESRGDEESLKNKHEVGKLSVLNNRTSVIQVRGQRENG